MVAAILIGRGGSSGFPGKNLMKILGRSLMEYPLMAALNAKEIDEVYVSTDSEDIKAVARKLGAFVIDRPDYLCTKESLSEDAHAHGYFHVRDSGKDVELAVLLYCNAPMLLPNQLDQGIKILRENPEYDSVVNASEYNMYTPVRARRIGEDGLLQPFIPFENYPDNIQISCDRDAQGDVFFTGNAYCITRPRCIENPENGMLPHKLMGQKIYPNIEWGCLDVDYEWQVPIVEFWLKEHGFTENAFPY